MVPDPRPWPLRAGAPLAQANKSFSRSAMIVSALPVVAYSSSSVNSGLCVRESSPSRNTRASW